MSPVRDGERWAVVPAYNESASIAAVVRRIRDVDLKCLVVDDGSDDGTAETARRAGADVVIRHDKNRGYATAVGGGLRAAADIPGCRWVVTLDADGQLDPRDAVALIEMAEDADVPLALGIRPAHARAAERFASWLVEKLVGVSDPLCGIKAYRSDLLRAYAPRAGRRVAMELAVAAAAQGHGFVQRPVATAPSARAGSRYGHGVRSELRILGATLALMPVAVRLAR
jgi:glycosyltransferase involved in cell wall biosynthesis